MPRARPPIRTRNTSTEGFPPEAVAEAEELMAELDVIHPGWRTYAPYMYEPARRARVTWLLCRLERQVLWRGGGPSRLEWRIRIVKAHARNRDPNSFFPHPVYPGQEWHESWWVPPPLEGFTAEPAGPSASELAFDLDMSLARVERLLPTCPADRDPREWLADLKRRTGGAQ